MGAGPLVVLATLRPSASIAQAASENADVVVVGSGLAGLAAALSAQENGAKVVLLEKEQMIGGDSILATGDIFVCCSSVQKAAGVVDSPDAFYKDAMAKSDGRRDPVQTRMMADYGGQMVDWLISQGVQFDPHVVSTMGSSAARDQHAVGWAPGLINTLGKTATAKGIPIVLRTRATQLITGNDGRIAGIEATKVDGTPIRYAARAVVLASGGFGANPDLLRKFCPRQADAIWAASPAETGDGLVMALNQGADTTDIDVPWLTPTVEIKTRILITSNVLSKGGILLNSKAERFTDETASYEQASQAVMDVLKTGEPFVYEIYDDGVNQKVYRIAEYVKAGMAVQGSSLQELAQKVGLDSTQLKATVDDFNAGLESKHDRFGRTIFGDKLEKPPFGCLRVKPGSVLTPGGLKIDDQVRVVKKGGGVIPGLYAAGEVTGGYRAYGYIGGDSLAQCGVSGMIGGKDAALFARKT